MQAPQPPILAFEGEEVHVFRSVDNAATYFEPIDVENDEYAVFDSIGRRIQLGIEQVPDSAIFGLLRYNRDQIVLKSVDANPSPDELAARIRASLAAAGRQLPAESEPLSSLVEKLVDRVGFLG